MQKFSKQELMEMVDSLKPKIKKSLQNVAYADREDLEQELMLKIIESYEKIAGLNAPNFEEFLNSYLNKQK
ncbi:MULTISPECIES: hypothetical protein [Bacillaceae]|uniref:DNA-directed RNA polymerase specialized sigma24 family protein n=1 Tax=Peribacillus huizhouensis TaxID=1501239 RepID=A0ABR6CPJ2_9BACI|nr:MULTISPECIES: hypothetical protein [Bacillaceae]MBA9026957.1 DNA-directed RNA polymerase specialized sigma24 family protein [Peribacillus huizhouensis]